MRGHLRSTRLVSRLALLALVASLAVLAAACGGGGGGDEETTAAAPTTEAADTGAPAATTEAADTSAPADTGAPATSSTMIQQPGQCGSPDAQGQKASGDPIKLGGIATNVPGIDFTWITGMVKAYFDCVNDNGGIGGRPIQYIAEEEQVDPQQIASLATKLAEQDKVLGFVGNTSIIDCSVNKDYYTQNGFYLIVAGVDQACFTTPVFSAVNMGPYYSSLGGAQAAVRAGAKGTLVVVSPNQPGFDVINSGVTDFAEQQGMKGVSILEDVPIADPAGLAQRLVQEAGDGGGVVLDFTGPAVVPLLQAIEQQGLIDSVVWASSTPPNDPSVAQELSDAWNGKFLINAEFNVLDSGLPDQNHMNAVREQYASDIPNSSFAQMGYLAGRAATEALLSIDGEITKESVNQAFHDLKNVTSDIWCQPWYFASTLDENVSNNMDITVTPQDGKMVKAEDCFLIAELPQNPLAAIRAKEKELGLNTGG
jgi:branched-chain amino acid transport system substrate-binding protein